MRMRWPFVLSVMLVMGGCTVAIPQTSGPQIALDDTLAARSTAYVPLADFPKRETPIAIAVYAIPDKTGSNLKSENFAEFSKAVSQGADALVVEALSEVGSGTWFTIVERESLDPLLQERRMAMAQAEEERQREHAKMSADALSEANAQVDAEIARLKAQLLSDYQGASASRLQQMPPFAQAMADLGRHESTLRAAIAPAPPYERLDLPPTLTPMTIAEYIVTGAIVGHDSDVVSTGTGFRLQNVGVLQRVQKDVITVSLRLVHVASGEIIANETASQTVLSTNKQGDVLNYITLNKILEFESGYVTNEPRSLALDAAFRMALSAILIEAAETWRTTD